MKPVAQKPVPASSFDLKTGKVMTLLFALIAFSIGLKASEWYAAPNATTNGNGSITNPWDLATAIGDNTYPSSPNRVVHPGDTIWLRGGTYHGGFTCLLTGTNGLPITVKPYNGEWAIIQSTNYGVAILYINRHWSTFNGIELCNSDPNRWNDRGMGIYVNGANTTLINLIIHDVGVGVYFYADSTHIGAAGSLIYGCVCYNNGCEGQTEAHAHSIYGHSALPGTSIKNNIMLNGFGYGIQCYAEQGEPLTGFDIEGNVAANAGILNTNLGDIHIPNYQIGGHTPMTNLVFSGNIGYQPANSYWNLELGYQTYGQYSGTVQSNYLVGGKLRVLYWTNLTFSGNTLADFATTCTYGPVGVQGAYYWNSNTYIKLMPNSWNIQGVTNWTSPSTWFAFTGFDSNSIYLTNNPSSPAVFIWNNAYESGRANIAIMNWATNDNVSVDVSGALSTGMVYSVRNAADYFGAVVATGTYSGGTISLPMTNLSVAVPIGMQTAPAPTGPRFNAFVIIGNPPPAPPPIILTGAAKLPNGAFQFAFTNTPAVTNYIATNITTTIITNWSTRGPPRITGYTTNITVTVTTNTSEDTATVLATTNLLLPLTNWTVLGTVTDSPPGHFQFTDPQATNRPLRFYRVRSP